MKTVQNIIRRNIQGKKVLFLLTNVVYTAMLLVTIPMVMDFVHGMNLLDMMPMGYNLEYVHSLFQIPNPRVGRSKSLLIPVDSVGYDISLLFGISYCLVLAYFLNKGNKLKSPFVYLCLLPVIAGIFDYLENFGILALLSGYSEISNSIVTITSSFTILKSITSPYTL